MQQGNDKYGYTLNTGGLMRGGTQRRYCQRELEGMTTYQLREICRREKIIHGVVHPLDKDELLRVILRYRGADEDLLIRSYNAEGMMALQDIFRQVPLREESDMRPVCSAKIVVYEGLAVGFYDELTIAYQAAFAGTNAFVVNGDGALCAVFNVEAKGGATDVLYLTKAADLPCEEARVKNYSLLLTDRTNSELLYRIYSGDDTRRPRQIPIYRAPLLDFAVRQAAPLAMPLAIDFGTSNTTAGVYLDSLYFERAGWKDGQRGLRENNVNYAVFYDVTQAWRETALLPSVVGVLAVREDADPIYVFGYEAVRLADASYIDEGFCVFYDIKRWIGDYEKSEEITDKSGRRAFVKRKEILRAYFLFVIDAIRNRYKCKIESVHISSPVKQKYLFQQMFAEILPEYAIERDDMLDEGVSVLYNTISEMVAQGAVQEKCAYKALIIDCGGGTTDLSSCTFSVSNRRVSYRIDIETAYENGDTDFGGNNLTYRIMQLLKIKLWKALAPLKESEAIPDTSELLATFDIDVFRYVDANGPRAIYAELDAAYVAAEAFLPTKFGAWENLSRVDYYKVKNNFYFLYHTAERIKKEFYNRIGTLRVILTSDENAAESAGATALLVDKWKLSVNRDGALTMVKAFSPIDFSIFDIVFTLRAEIYGVIHKFLNGMYESGELDDFSLIKLTGQSCKIDIFREALKEFVPGKTIQFKRKSGDLTDDFELKMTCIDGALKYLKDKKYGFADVNITSRAPQLPYSIMARTHTGREVTLIHGLKKNKRRGCISRNMDDLTLKLDLKDMEGKLRYQFTYRCTLEEFQEVRHAEILASYGENIPQDETDSIEGREVKFFVWTEARRWGFLVVPVYRQEGQSAEMLMLGRAQFFSFENDVWVRNFFDGTV